jgi:hypothetical protein
MLCSRKRVEEYPSGQYYLNIAGRWIGVGEGPVEAIKAQQREEARLAAIANGLTCHFRAKKNL